MVGLEPGNLYIVLRGQIILIGWRIQGSRYSVLGHQLAVVEHPRSVVDVAPDVRVKKRDVVQVHKEHGEPSAGCQLPLGQHEPVAEDRFENLDRCVLFGGVSC